MLSILLLTIVLTKRHLNFPPSLLLPFITVILGAYGLAFMIGALALLFKRIQQLLGLFQFVLLFLLMTPTETWTGSLRVLRLLLPMTIGAGELRNLMVRNQSLDLSVFVLALLNGVMYLAFGLVVFRWAERKAKLQGILSGY
jgi:ABC-2 type transport system permease protein